MKNRNAYACTRIDTTYPCPSLPNLSHIVTLEPVQPCVPVYSAVTRPSGGLGCWAGQGLLDTVWTRPTRAGAFSPREGGYGGFRGAAYRRKDLVNLFHFSSDPPSSPSKAPLPGKSCPYTYGALEGPSRSTQGAVSLISSKKSLPVSE
jgi:hypothetical protein